MAKPQSILLQPLPARSVYLARNSARGKTNPLRSRRLRPPRRAIRDYVPIFSAIRPRLPFASIPPASAQRPRRESMRLGIRLSGEALQDAPPNSEFQRTEKSDSRPA